MENGPLATLVLEIAAADQAAFSRLYDATGPELFGMVSGLFASPEKADEVLLDVYTDVWRHAGSFIPGSQPVLVWLRSLASLRVLENLRPDGGRYGTTAAPPEYLKDLLMARIEREPRLAALHAKADPRPDSLRPGAASSAGAPASDPVRRFGPWVLGGIALIAALLFLYRWRAAEQARAAGSEELQSARASLDETRGKLAAAAPGAEDLQRINRVLRNAGSRVIGLDALPPGQAPGLAILWDVRTGEWLVMGHAQPPPQNRVYRLWLLTPGQRRPVGILKTDAVGRIFTVLRSPEVIARPATLQVTLEPEAGSVEPSSPGYALGRIM